MRADPEEARALALAGDVDGLVTLVANTHLRGIPLAWVFDRVIAPAMHEIGEGRVRGTVSVAQEHMATNAISETIARVRPLVESRQRPDRGRALCACIGEEKHDLAARMVALILIEQGYRTAMVGASIPSGDLARMLASERPSLVAIAASSQAKPEMLRGDLAILASAAAASRTRVAVVGGGFARLPSLPGAVRRHDSLADLMADVPPPAAPPPAAPPPSAAAEQKAAG